MGFKKVRKKIPSKMHYGNWNCAECGKEINELPFKPHLNRPLYCKECWVKKRPK